jgi:hypothetical protein
VASPSICFCCILSFKLLPFPPKERDAPSWEVYVFFCERFFCHKKGIHKEEEESIEKRGLGPKGIREGRKEDEWEAPGTGEN